ncbi:hypothetical protein FRC02_002516 [Tulasnella sp. 418]|nr:hypothetical protein FRC02_002516 [Tulasnella sp. 418]
MAPQEIPLATPSTSNGFDISSSSNGGTEVGLEFGFGIVYHIQTPQQFWNEIEDVLSVTHSSSVSLAVLDNALKTFITLCAEHHGKPPLFLNITSPFRLTAIEPLKKNCSCKQKLS